MNPGRALLVLSGLTIAAGGAPPAPPAVCAVAPRLAELRKWNESRGDTWDPFWADDGLLYSFNCDGPGFGPRGQKRNLAFNRFRGDRLAELTGELVNAMTEYGAENETGPDGATWKACGAECFDGIFYAFVARNVYGHSSGDPWLRQTSRNCSLIKSADRGRTWTRAAQVNLDSPMWPADAFGAPGFFHYGQDGGSVTQDGAAVYAYALSNDGYWNGGDSYRLGRVRRTRLPQLRAADWEYFRGGDGAIATAWTSDAAQARPVLSAERGCGWTAPTFVPALTCYLLVAWSIEPPLTKWFEPSRVHYAFHTAPHPWGPWERVGTMDDSFLVGDHLYGPTACARFQEVVPGGVKVWIFNSGCPFGSSVLSPYKAIAFPVILRTRALPRLRDLAADAPEITPGRDGLTVAFRGTAVEVLADRTAVSGELSIELDGRPAEQVVLAQHDFVRLQRIPVFLAENLADHGHELRLRFSRPEDAIHVVVRIPSAGPDASAAGRARADGDPEPDPTRRAPPG